MEPKDAGKHSRWEEVHRCPKCAYELNMEKVALKSVMTGIVTCPKCNWSAPLNIQIVKAGKPTQ